MKKRNSVVTSIPLSRSAKEEDEKVFSFSSELKTAIMRSYDPEKPEESYGCRVLSKQALRGFVEKVGNTPARDKRGNIIGFVTKVSIEKGGVVAEIKLCDKEKAEEG